MMNFCNIPVLCGFYVLPAYELFPEVGGVETPLEGQPAPNNGYIGLQECWQEFELFMQKIDQSEEEASNIRYMDLLDKPGLRNVPGFSDFKEIYCGGLERYRASYRPDERKTSWGKEDIVVLLWIVDRYSRMKGVHPKDFEAAHWTELARLVPFRNGSDCMFKWLSLRRCRLDLNPWTPEEEESLFQLVSEQPQPKKDWVSISRKLYGLHPTVYRSPKQCREHWALYINETHDRSKKLWNLDEDLVLLDLYKKVGRRWKTISSNLVGRSENAIKNRFTLLLNKYGGEHGKATPQTIDSIKQQILTISANETLEREFPGLKPSMSTLPDLHSFRPEPPSH